jgi:hypothetical protein
MVTYVKRKCSFTKLFHMARSKQFIVLITENKIYFAIVVDPDVWDGLGHFRK